MTPAPGRRRDRPADASRAGNASQAQPVTPTRDTRPPADGWYRRDVPVRFRDLDAMGHAHHTLPLVFLEEARAAFWRALRGTGDVDAIDYVMAEVTVRFHARILYPSTVRVLLAVSDVGTKSFRTDFELRGDDGTLLAAGSAVQVAYDYGASASKPLDPVLREALAGWQAAYEKSRAMPAEIMPMNAPRT
jgi:acyl-CoA thioester hydrolase